MGAKRIIILYCVFYCSLATGLWAQTPAIDSLRTVLTLGQGDRLATLFALCGRGESMPSDTMMAYAQQAREISVRNRDNRSRLQAEVYIGWCMNLKGLPDSCLRICNEGIRQTNGTDSLIDLCHRFMRYKIVALTKLRKLKEAIDECFVLLRSGEQHNDATAQINAYNNLGVNNNILGNHAEALKWFNKAFGMIRAGGLSMDFPLVFTNMSAVYFSIGREDSGYYFLDRGFVIARAHQDLRNESDCYTLQGLIYSQQGKLDSAGKMLEKASQLQRQIGNIQFIIVGLGALETFYARQKNYSRAIEYIRQAEAYSRKFHEPLTFAMYADLAECYKLTKNYAAYGEAMDTLMRMKDSMYVKSRADDLARLEAQYEVSSKEAFIAKQKLELLHKDIWIGSVVLGALLMASGAYFLIRRNRRRQVIALKEAEERERKRIAADLHDNIGAYASAISAGIDELETKKIVTDTSSIRHLKSNAAEIISSLRDTIWAFNKESIDLTGISDRVKGYVQKIQPSYPLLAIRIEERIDGGVSLSPVRALHVFRIIQEAVHNAVRHSAASAIVITIINDRSFVRVSIEDNGIGFDPAAVGHAGNGLLTMQHRAAEAGFALFFENPDAGGIRVRLEAGNG
jgi:signal transduction histidine kinase